MKIYRINATIGGISFNKNIEASSRQDALNKFNIIENSNNHSFPYYQDEMVIKSINRRY